MEDTKEKYFDTKQASKEAGVSVNAICTAIKNGKLQASQISDSSRFGYHYLVSETALIEWMNNRWKRGSTTAAPKALSQFSLEDIADELTRRIKKAYEEGYKDGVKKAKQDILTAMKGVK